VDLSKNSKAIGCIWIFRKKDNKQYKVRLVAKEYAQKESIDYNDIFSPVIKRTFIQMLLVIVTQFDLELEQSDVKIIFLYGKLEKDIYIKQLEGYIHEGRGNKVCLLKKSLCELKQCPRQWYKWFNSFMSRPDAFNVSMIVVSILSRMMIQYIFYYIWMIC